MNVKKDGKNISFVLDGPIGETCPLFTYVLAGFNRVAIDMTGVTFINSIGVKFWILWTIKIPKDCQVTLFNAPFVIASQASMVVGFVTSAITIESVRAPFLCEECSHEEIRLLSRGTDYQYATGGLPARMDIGPVACPRCKKGKLEPDFFVSKTFKFLELAY